MGNGCMRSSSVVEEEVEEQMPVGVHQIPSVASRSALIKTGSKSSALFRTLSKNIMMKKDKDGEDAVPVRGISEDLDHFDENLSMDSRGSFRDLKRLASERAMVETGNILSKYTAKRVWSYVLGIEDPLAPNTNPVGMSSKLWTGALLLVDVSGFTALSEHFAKQGSKGIEQFTQTMINLFSNILQCILGFGGDVDCFAGDALIVAFQSNSSLEAARRALQCGLELNDRFSPFQACAGHVITLHSAIGVGENLTFDVGGGLSGQRATFIMGEAMAQLRMSHKQTNSGEVIVSEQVWEFVKRYVTKSIPRDFGCVVVCKMMKLLPPVAPKDPMFTHIALASINQICRRYVPKVVCDRIGAGQENYLGEHRNVTVAFVNMCVEGLTDNPHCPSDVQDRLQNAVVGAMDTVFNSDGFIRQVTIDDKGLVFIYAFGVPGCSHDNDPVRAIRVAVQLMRDFPRIGVTCGIGVASGAVYCGNVGCTSVRCDYALVGDTVNLAARLAGKAYLKKTCYVCSETAAFIQQMGTIVGAIDFQSQEDITVKGKSGPITVFVPKIAQSTGWSLIRSLVVPNKRTRSCSKADLTNHTTVRSSQLSEIQSQLMLWNELNVGGVLMIEGTPGSGKARLLEVITDCEHVGHVIEEHCSDCTNTQSFSLLKTLIKAVVVQFLSGVVNTFDGNSVQHQFNVSSDVSVSNPVNVASDVSVSNPVNVASDVSFAPASPNLATPKSVASTPSEYPSRSRGLSVLSLGDGEAEKILKDRLRRFLTAQEIEETKAAISLVEPAFPNSEKFTSSKGAVGEYVVGMATMTSDDTQISSDDDFERNKNLSKLLRKAFRAFLLIAQEFAESLGSRVSIILHDIHEADASSLTCISWAFEKVYRSRLLCTTRPNSKAKEVLFPAVPLDSLTSDHQQYRHVVLAPLTLPEIEAFATQTLRVDNVPSQLIDFLGKNCEGNLMFCKETLNTLIASGALSIQDRKCTITAALTTLSLPKSMNGIIVARMDMLPPQLSMVLKVASVLGVSFDKPTLEALFPVDRQRARLQQHLDELVETMFLTLNVKTDLYSFVSESCRDVIYSTLLHSYRRQLHRAVAEHLEGRADGRSSSFCRALSGHMEIPLAMKDPTGELPLKLAEHWAACVPDEDTGDENDRIALERAAAYKFIVAKQAAKNFLLTKAVSLFQESLEYLMRLPPSPERNFREFLTIVEENRAVQVLKGISSPEALDLLNKSLALTDIFIGPTPSPSAKGKLKPMPKAQPPPAVRRGIFRVFFAQCRHLYDVGDLQGAAKAFERIKTVNPKYLESIQCMFIKGNLHMSSGEYRECNKLAWDRYSVETHDVSKDSHVENSTHLLQLYAVSSILLGAVDGAIWATETILDHCDDITPTRSFVLFFAVNCLGHFLATGADPLFCDNFIKSKTNQILKKLSSVLEEDAIPVMFHRWEGMTASWIQVCALECTDGLSIVKNKMIPILEKAPHPVYFTLVASALIKLKEYDHAFKVLSVWKTSRQNTSGGVDEKELLASERWRLLGICLCARNQKDDAIKHFLKAASIAESQKSPILQINALLDLALMSDEKQKEQYFNKCKTLYEELVGIPRWNAPKYVVGTTAELLHRVFPVCDRLAKYVTLQ